MRYPAGTVDVRGTQIPVYVDDHGAWEADHLDKNYVANSRDELRERLMTATRRATARVEVRFARLDRQGYGEHARWFVNHGTATGIHAGTGNLLVRWDNGIAEQLSAYRDALTPMSADEQAELIRLQEAADAAATALREFKASHAMKNLREAILKAIDARKEPGEK